MNIREHIEAGHYPKDEKGRAVVKMKDGRTATICATDGPDGEELVGWRSGHSGEIDAVCSWQENGCWQVKSCHLDLLPPPPHKFRRYAALTHEQLDALRMYDSDGPARRELEPGKMLTVVEYEVDWS